ncbi:hypothetical protein BE221DRAFT_53708, partial [Ostreococcus tauri]
MRLLIFIIFDVIRFGRLRSLGAADPSAARARHAVTSRRLFAESLEFVINRQLLSGLDVSGGEYPNSELAAHHPFLRLAVRRARVVQEPPFVPAQRRVDGFAAGERHEVVMAPSLVVIPLLTLGVRVFVQDLSAVLHDKLPSSHVLGGEQAVTLFTHQSIQTIRPAPDAVLDAAHTHHDVVVRQSPPLSMGVDVSRNFLPPMRVRRPFAHPPA